MDYCNERINFNLDEFKKYIAKAIDGKSYCITYYMSSMEGLGTNFSDIDIYVIYEGEVLSETAQKRRLCIVDMFKIGNQELDVEFYSLVEFESLLKKIRETSLAMANHNVFDINIDLFKFIHKFYISKVLDESMDFKNIYKLEEINELNNNIISRNYYDLYRADLDDGIKFYKDYRFVESFYQLQKAFVNLSYAVFSKHGITTTKGKWFIKRVFQMSEMGYNGLENFLMQYYFCKYKEISKSFIDEAIRQLRIISLEVI